jgi:PAS domain S-box-containing protein
MMKKTFAVPGEVSLDDLLAGFPHPAAVLDEGFKIVTMNRLFEALTGHGTDAAVGVYADFILRSNMGNSRGQVFQRVLETGETAAIDGDIINRSRKKVPVRFTVSQLHTRKGQQSRGLLLIAEDITALQATVKTTLYREWSTDIIGHSPKMQAVFEIMPLMARTEASILITGETGTGKDKIAETIHRNSPRGKYQFIKINCGALPPDLLESELFGHVKGAFTGALRDKPGMFKLADRGTIFLTEIGDMPLPLQVKLLSVLDDRAFYPVGGERKETVDVRVIAATHRSLREQVECGAFREDLFYRLNVLHIHLPPLREREGDIRFLLDYFLKDYATRLGKEVQTFSTAALDLLINYHFPGNIRELRNIVEYCANVCRCPVIDRNDLPGYLLDRAREGVVAAGPSTTAGRDEQPVPDESAPAEVKAGGENWAAIEREMILEALKAARGNRSKAAGVLGWGRTTLWRKMIQHGLA